MRVVDLFSGVGGLSLGLQNAGFDVVLAVDNWKPAITMYEANFTHPIIDVDLLNVAAGLEIVKQYKPDMIVGGPPCQDYSSAGKRDEENGKADLTISFAKIIEAIKPTYFIMENVDQIVKSRRYAEAMQLFKDAGYGLTAKTLDASLAGAPQKRKRHFVIGSLNHEDNFLMDTLMKNLSEKPTTIRDYLGESLGVDHYYRHPRNYNRRGVYSIDEPSPTVRGVNRPFPPGYPGHKNDTSKEYAAVRPLTSKERSLIQTFPENFELIGTKGAIEQAIGNAVPVKLAEYVGNALNEFLATTPQLSKAEVFEPTPEPLVFALPEAA